MRSLEEILGRYSGHWGLGSTGKIACFAHAGKCNGSFLSGKDTSNDGLVLGPKNIADEWTVPN